LLTAFVDNNDVHRHLFLVFVIVHLAGLLPLVASISRESSQQDLANSFLALIFGPIGSIGHNKAPLATLGFYSITTVSAAMQWRMCIAVGAVPAILLIIMGLDETTFPQQAAELNEYNQYEEYDKRLDMLDPRDNGNGDVGGVGGADGSSDEIGQAWTVSTESFSNEADAVRQSSLLRRYMVGLTITWFMSDLILCK
jgi:hypothetical protein